MRKPVYAICEQQRHQPVHLRSLITAFVVRCLDGMIPPVSISEISSLYLASVAAQAGLCLTWSQTPKTGFLVTRLNYVKKPVQLALGAFHNEPLHKKTCLRDFRPGKTQTGLLSYTDKLEYWNFGFWASRSIILSRQGITKADDLRLCCSHMAKAGFLMTWLIL